PAADFHILRARMQQNRFRRVAPALPDNGGDFGRFGARLGTLPAILGPAFEIQELEQRARCVVLFTVVPETEDFLADLTLVFGRREIRRVLERGLDLVPWRATAVEALEIEGAVFLRHERIDERLRPAPHLEIVAVK